MMDFYAINLAGFAAINALLLHYYYRRMGKAEIEEKDHRREANLIPSWQESEVKKFIIDYFPGYALAVAADWIQVSVWGDFQEGVSFLGPWPARHLPQTTD